MPLVILETDSQPLLLLCCVLAPRGSDELYLLQDFSRNGLMGPLIWHEALGLRMDAVRALHNDHGLKCIRTAQHGKGCSRGRSRFFSVGLFIDDRLRSIAERATVATRRFPPLDDVDGSVS